MNRRDLIKRITRTALGIGVAAVGVKAVAADGASSWRMAVARRMINDSGEMWLAVNERYRGQNPVVVGFDDDQAIEIKRGNSKWELIQRRLTETEARDLQAYKRTLRPIYRREPVIGDHIGLGPNREWTLRSYVKNGRRPGWIMSAEKTG